MLLQRACARREVQPNVCLWASESKVCVRAVHWLCHSKARKCADARLTRAKSGSKGREAAGRCAPRVLSVL